MARNPFDTDDPRTADFMRQFTAHQRQIYAYIRTLLVNPADADDVWQNTNLVLWKKFDTYEQGTNFRAWAYRIAHFEVLNHRAKAGRSGPQFSEGFLDQIAGEVEKQSDQLEARLGALRVCLGTLSERDRDLIERRYEKDATGDSVADAVGRSRRAVYKSVTRIRRSLLDCVRARLQEEDA